MFTAMSILTNFSDINIQNNNSSDKANQIYYGLLQENSSKIIFLGLALLLTVFSELLTTGGVWYDYYTSNNYKTLVNIISTAIAWTTFIMIPLIEVIDVLGFRPMSELYCLFALIFKNTIKVIILLFGDFFIVSRYALIFHLKNPLALKDYFFIIFICLWNVTFSCIYNFVFFALPGKKPFSYYICANVDPSSDSHLPSKINIYIEAFSLLLQVVLNTRIKLYKRSNCAVTDQTITQSQETKNHLISLDEKTINNLTTTASAILVFVTYIVLNFKVMSLTLVQINSYPTNMFVIAYVFLGPVILSILINTVYYMRSPKLRRCLWQEIQKYI